MCPAEHGTNQKPGKPHAEAALDVLRPKFVELEWFMASKKVVCRRIFQTARRRERDRRERDRREENGGEQDKVG